MSVFYISLMFLEDEKASWDLIFHLLYINIRVCLNRKKQNKSNYGGKTK